MNDLIGFDTFKFNIPDIGDCFQLVEDWEFPLHLEGRNHTLINRVKPGTSYGWQSSNNTLLVTFEAGTVISVDRIYIRKGKSEWSSITFIVKYAPGDIDRAKQTTIESRWRSHFYNLAQVEDKPEQKRKGSRFWVKLEVVNEAIVRRIDKSKIPVDVKPTKKLTKKAKGK